MNNRYEFSLFLLRITLGATFLAHGWQKATNLEATTAFFVSLGLPAALTYVVAFTETAGGAALLVGLFPRLASLGLAAVMVGAIASLKFSKGFLNGYEYELVLLMAAVALAVSGSRFLALGSLLRSLQQK